MARLLIIIFIAGLFSSCSRNDLSISEKKYLTREIDSTLKNYYSDIRSKGLVAEFKYLDSSADFFWVPPGYNSPISYDSVVAILNKNQLAFRMVDNTWENLLIVPINRELASYTGRISSTTTDSSGKTFNTTLLETGVLRKRKDGWKLLNGQTSIVPPM